MIHHGGTEIDKIVTPAKAGVQGNYWVICLLDSRFRGNDNYLRDLRVSVVFLSPEETGT